MKKRILAMILSICLLVGVLPGQALAAIGDLVGNTSEENTAILNDLTQLNGTTDEDEAKAKALLESLGLLDADGNLNISKSIWLDGVEMTLAQVEALLATPGVDLTRVATVDDTEIPLGDLKTMIQIERELQRIKDTYFSDRTFQGEAVDNLNSLLEQIETGTINVRSQAALLGEEAALPVLKADRGKNNDYWVTITAGNDKEAGTTLNDTYPLTLTGTVPVGGATVTWTQHPGVLTDSKLMTYTVTAQGGTQITGTDTEKVLTFQEGTYNNTPVASVKVEMTKTIKETMNLDGMVGEFFSSFAFHSPTDLVLVDKGGGAQSHVYYEVSGTKKERFTGATSSKNYLGNAYKTEMEKNDEKVWMWENDTRIYWPLGKKGDNGYYDDYEHVERTAKYVFGTETPQYVVKGGLVLFYDTSSSGVPNMYFKRSLPIGAIKTTKDIQYDRPVPQGDPMTVVDYYWSDKSDVRDQKDMFRITVGEENVLKAEASSSGAAAPEHAPYMPVAFRDKEALKDASTSVFMVLKGDRPPFTLELGWPKAGIFTNTTDPDDTNEVSFYARPASDEYLNKIYKSEDLTVSLYDETAPEVVSVTMPAGTYYSGGTPSIFVKFSEPVLGSTLKIKANGRELDISPSNQNTVSTIFKIPYRVLPVDNTNVIVNSISGMKDIMDNTGAEDKNGGTGWEFSNVNLVTTLLRDAAESVTVNPATIAPDAASRSVDITLAVSQDEKYRNKYEDKCFEAVITGGAYDDTIPMTLEVKDGVSKFTATTEELPAAVATDKNLTVKIQAVEKENGMSQRVDTGKSTTVTLTKMIAVTEVTITASNPSMILDPTISMPRLTVKLEGAGGKTPTYNSGKWSSSDTKLATIDKDGQIAITGAAVGKVKFTYTADNGDLMSSVKGTTGDYTVVVGEYPALTIPASTKTVVVRSGAAAQVRWGGNAGSFAPGDFKYQVKLYEGYYTTDAALADLTPIAVPGADTIDKALRNFTIPENILKKLSTGDTPAYTVQVSMPHPLSADGSQRLTALCHIVVRPAEAGVALTKPSSLYITHSGSVDITWTVKNYVSEDANKTQGTFRVDRITTENGTDKTIPVCNEPITAATGNYLLDPAAVTGLKDTYIVTLQAKNSADLGYSIDSFPLYVYNPNALDLEVGGARPNTLTMDNEPIVKSSPLPTGTKEILAMRETLGLLNYIGINYSDYSWNQISDRIKWSSDKSSIVSVNYKQGSRYEDLSRFTMTDYLPETIMALSGLKNGEATITATHANVPEMKSEVKVKVNTLQNKFYLFQLSPAQLTKLTYTNGKGELTEVSTNSEGVLALYEPDEIKSNVTLKAIANNGKDVFLGTIYKEDLLSGERDATKLQLYPLNTLKLRQAAKVEIYLKKPDGTPFTGNVTLRGGVYKNGGYCETAQLRGNSPDNLVDGKTDQTAALDSTGKLTIYMDSTQFWSTELREDSGAADKLSATDDLQYVFELRGLEGDKYCPVLVYANGNLTYKNVITTAENVSNLVEKASIGGEQPFVSNQFMDYGLSGSRLIDVRQSKGHVGPSQTFPSGKLITTMLLWGQDAAAKDYTIQMVDDFSFAPPNQTGKLITYPFSSIGVMRSTMVLDHDTVTQSGWVAPGKDMGLKARLGKGDTMLREVPISPRITDITTAPKVTDGDKVQGIMTTLKKGSTVPKSDSGGGTGNALIDSIGGKLGDISGPVNGSVFKMIITPSDDNSVFNAFIWAGYNSLGLDDITYTNEGLYVDSTLAQGQLSMAPSVSDLTNMAKGSYNPSQDKANAKQAAAEGRANTSLDISGQLEGYFEAQIRYSHATGEWEVYVLGGGFTVGIGVGFTADFNVTVGPVPITASLGIGGAIQLDYKSAVRYKQSTGLAWKEDITESSVNDFLTTLRINAYVQAFAGIGFDYSVVALKIGLFGSLTVDSQNKFLSRPYLKESTARQIDGQAVQLGGTIGMKFVAKFLGLCYEYILVSGGVGYQWILPGWKEIDDYWTKTDSGLGRSSRMAMAAFSAESGLVPVRATTTLESRDYLDDYTRTWGSTTKGRAVDAENGLKNLQTNAYPYSLPMVSDDGRVLLYASDGSDGSKVTDTRIYATSLENGFYPQGTVITEPASFPGYGDSDMRLSGTGTFAAAAWVRQSATLNKGPGEAVSTTEQAMLLNGTEVVASVRNASGTWTATRLTNNGSPDLAPVVATSGEHTIVAWRNVYAGDQAQITTFNQQNCIQYSIYNKTAGTWSAPHQLYDGTAGAVMGIEAAILPDGKAAVAYTLDRVPTDSSAADYEIAYTMIDTTKADFAGQLGTTVILTNDKWLDENPQISAVKFDDGDYRLILGWHSVQNGISDIRMAAIRSDGNPSNSFPASISQVAKGVNISSDFRFVGMVDTRNSLNNLSILWKENVTTTKGEMDHDVLRAVKFKSDSGVVSLSAPLDVATLADRTLANHFDAYVSSDDGKTIKAVIQATWYDTATDSVTIPGQTDSNGNPRTVQVPKEETRLLTATELYVNKVLLGGLMVDYSNLDVNTFTPVQFTVFNAGMDPVDTVKIELTNSTPGTETFTFDHLNLAPNGSTVLTCQYLIKDKIENLEYKLTADSRAPLQGKVYLDYPDVGISALNVVSEEKGKRTMQMTLYNSAPATLSGKSREVRIGFYDDSLFENAQAVACNTATVDVDSTSKILTIKDDDALALMDQGAFTLEVTFDIAAYVGADKEIPDNGVRLYSKVWIEEPDTTTTPSTMVVLPEYNSADNAASVNFESQLQRQNKVPTTLSVAQGLNGEGKTTATVTLHNNSLKEGWEGNLIVSLMDADGKVLEKQQSYTPPVSSALARGNTAVGASTGAIVLAGEETATRSFTFSQKGARVVANFGKLDLDESSRDIASLTLEGLPIRAEDFTPDNYYMVSVTTKLASTRLYCVPANPNARFQYVDDDSQGDVISLNMGENTFMFQIISADGKFRHYRVTVTRVDPATPPVPPTPTPTPSPSGDDDDTPVKPKPWVNPFGDMKADDWFFESVRFVYEKGLMKGISEGVFAPKVTADRATLVTILWRQAGCPKVDKADFTDVPDGLWYSEAVAWAVKEGIVSGYGNGLFGPGDVISREQLAVLLYRYAGEPAGRGDMSAFSDGDSISSWATEAMAWMVAEGLLQGSDGKLNPSGSATRAEVATMLARFFQK